MKFLFVLLLIPLLVIPAYGESQTLPTEKGTLDVKLTYDDRAKYSNKNKY